jgi:hypothetical protein
MDNFFKFDKEYQENIAFTSVSDMVKAFSERTSKVDVPIIESMPSAISVIDIISQESSNIDY